MPRLLLYYVPMLVMEAVISTTLVLKVDEMAVIWSAANNEWLKMTKKNGLIMVWKKKKNVRGNIRLTFKCVTNVTEFK